MTRLPRRRLALVLSPAGEVLVVLACPATLARLRCCEPMGHSGAHRESVPHATGSPVPHRPYRVEWGT